MASYNENDVLKLREIFPTLDEDTIGAVLAHHHGDVYPAMLQLVEMLGDDEVQQATLAVLEAEDLGETAAQLDTDEQLAMALQEEFAFEDESRSRRGGSTPASGSRSAPNSGSKKSQGKLSNEAKQLLVKFGRYKSRNGTQRLLPTDGADSAAPDARDAYEPNFCDIGYDPPAPVPLVSTTRELEHRTEQMTLAEQDNLDEPTSSLPQADRDARYNQRLARARMSNKNVRAAQPPPPEPQEPNLINLQENLINVI